MIFFCTVAGLLPMYVRTWRKKILTYSTVMTMLGISLIIFGILTLTDNFTEDEIFNFMRIIWIDQDVNFTEAKAERFWDDVQVEYECCGLNSFYKYNSSNVPATCCAKDVKQCTIDNVFSIYCFNAVKEYYENFLVIVLATVAFATSFVCFMFIIVAFFSIRIFGIVEEPENVSVL